MTRDDASDGSDSDDSEHPIDGTAFLKAAALASVPADDLPDLLARVQSDLGPRIDEYRRQYERVAAEPDRETFLVERGHWERLGTRLGLSARERDAVERAHEAALERVGSAEDRREEFDVALEIRTGVVIGTDADDSGTDTGLSESADVDSEDAPPR
ncbi:hypothetical protein JCM18237_04470 [Halorubrum luteum]